MYLQTISKHINTPSCTALFASNQRSNAVRPLSWPAGQKRICTPGTFYRGVAGDGR